jgi:predicted dehydrogenase
VASAESRSVRIVVDQQVRFSAVERAMRRLVAQGDYGPVGFASFTVQRYRPEMRAFTGDNPFLWEQGVHSFNSLLAILDRPAVSVTAQTFQPSWSVYNGPTTAMGVIQFQGKLPCSYLGSFESRNNTSEIRLECEGGCLRSISENGAKARLEFAPPGQPFEPLSHEESQDARSAELFSIDAFYEAVTTGQRVDNDGMDNLRTLAMVDAFMRSAQSGKREMVRSFDLESREKAIPQKQLRKMP